MESIDFQNYKAKDFRNAISGVVKELAELQALKTQLAREKRTIETVMYMMHPKEAIRDGYLSATRSLQQRLRRAKEEEESKQYVCDERGCGEKRIAKGLCYTHYHEMRNKLRRQEKVSMGKEVLPPTNLPKDNQIMTTPEMMEVASRLSKS